MCDGGHIFGELEVRNALVLALDALDGSAAVLVIFLLHGEKGSPFEAEFTEGP